jgi:2'-5' RNA ligase
MRAFVAIDISQEVRARLAELQRELTPRCRGLRWTDAGEIHVTLQFLGEIAESQAEEISRELREAARAHETMELKASGVGAFPSARSVRVLWVGIKDESRRLEALQKDCVTRLTKFGFEAEKRVFSPHLTLGRAKADGGVRDIGRVIEEYVGVSAGTWRVSELVLYQSQLSQKGARYSVVEIFGLRT